MARIHGRRGVIYAELTSGSAPVAVTFLKSWSINFATPRVDVTAFGDTNVIELTGLPTVGGDFGGFFDDATAQFYANATQGFAGKLYLYPNSATTGQYFWGTANIDFSISAAVDAAAEVTSSWSAASNWTKVG